MSDPLETLTRQLRGLRLPVTTELALQDALNTWLTDSGLPFQREVRMGPKDRIDFMVSETIGIEVKTRYPRRKIYRQLERYCEGDRLSGLILVTGTYLGLPTEIHGVPVFLVSLGRSAL
uniref:hypothetical protein n=1 Tax=Roseovarius sp. BRH_c41 TaxID=1629709 RepID=UPI0025FDCD4B|nr:hypothetical protein [Roseovarius sp. BRH_c41]